MITSLLPPLVADINPHSFFFLLFALLACGFALAVLLTNNVVRMAFYLTLSLGATSGLFFLAGAEFVGAMQLLIYVGGTLVLLIFGVMLTAQARFISMQTNAAEWVMGALVGGMLLLLLLQTSFNVESWRTPHPDPQSITLADSQTSTPIGLALSGVRVDKLTAPNPERARGMSGYLLPFVIVSMHLLVVLLGAGYMARTKRRGSMTFLAPAPRVRPAIVWPVSVLGGLASGVIVNVLLAAVCFWLASRGVAALANAERPEATGQLAQWLIQLLSPAAPWLFPWLGLLFLANVLLLVVVWRGQKWGVVCLVLVPLLQAMSIANGNLGLVPAAVFLLLALGPAALLIALLTRGGGESLWSRME